MRVSELLIVSLLGACIAAAPPPPPPRTTTPPPPVETSTPAEPPAPATNPPVGQTTMILADGQACVASTQCGSGVCEGQGCGDNAPGVCAPRQRACTRDLREYCGCDGVTFRSSGSCPGRRYAAQGACSGTAP